MHRRISMSYGTGILASAFAGVLSYALGLMGGIRDMKGWRWIFAVGLFSRKYRCLTDTNAD